MKRSANEKQMLRLLHGELDAGQAGELRRRIAGDPALASRFAELERAWTALDLPPASVPIGWSGRLVAAAEDRVETEIRWRQAPGWARAGAAAALVVGMGIGVLLGPSTPAGEPLDWPSSELQSELADPLTLAETYWLMLDEEATASGEESS